MANVTWVGSSHSDPDPSHKSSHDRLQNHKKARTLPGSCPIPPCKATPSQRNKKTAQEICPSTLFVRAWVEGNNHRGLASTKIVEAHSERERERVGKEKSTKMTPPPQRRPLQPAC